ncbi:transglutaminaseTgpA domain-containing protein [Sphaerisporangium fuscum]|uniref:transglutaminaseTgpA domain-containing protein n=1 Tax=Sphaerisporangium fuscum TaxID=2835868 RepID=UPI001BDC3557|nr:transglutaminaseTgpA domain-containing protein [Sphaerisporangium fuscum]
MRLPMAAGLATAAVSITLYPLFRGGTWFWAGMGAILVVTAVATLTARHTVPRWVGPPLELLALSVFLTLVFARRHNWLSIIPTKDSAVTLAHLLGRGFTDIQRFAAPVPANAGIALLTAGGVGLIAVLVDLLAVRLRRAALAGLPLLALFTVPAAVLTDPIGWPAFIIGALGYVGLLVADGRERLSHWGRAVLVRRSRNTNARSQTDTAPLTLTGKRIGFAAIALAIGLPALLPTLQPNPLFGFGVGAGNGRGGNTITIGNPIASLRGQLTQPANATVLTYTNNDNTPRYLRVYSLDTFDGEQWTMSQPEGRVENRVADGPMPPAPGLYNTIPLKNVQTHVTVSEAVQKLNFLPLPYPASSVRAEGDWRADESTLMVFATRDTAGGKSYDVVTQEPQPTADDLENLAEPAAEDIRARYLQLPGDLPAQIPALSGRLVRESDTPYQKAVKLQQWFVSKGGFVYDLRTQGSGSQALLDFLRNRRGFCEQFAAAMAVMARTLGIPARVAIGYTGGASIGGEWQVRTHDLHAWPELYFQGAGWLRFEPTPAGGLGQATARVPDYSVPPVSPTTRNDEKSSDPTAGPDSGGPTGRLPGRRPVKDDPVVATGPIVVDEGLTVPAKVGIGVGVLLLVGLIPAAWRAATWYRRRRIWAQVATAPSSAEPPPDGAGARPGRLADERLGQAVHATWRELTDTLYDLGLGHEPSESPRALGRRLTEQYELDADSAASVARIASAEERLRYARTPGPIGSLAGDIRRVRRALRATVSRGRRQRAVLLPPSTLRRLRRAGEKVLDGFDRLENLRLWPRRRDGGASAPQAEERVLTGSRR